MSAPAYPEGAVDILAAVPFKPVSLEKLPIGRFGAHIFLEALTAAGWTLAPPGSRVVPEGGVDAADLIQRLDTAIKLGEATGSRGKHPSNIYNLAGEARAALRALAEAKP